MILLALLAVEGVTVLSVQGMITLHIYLGMLRSDLRPEGAADLAVAAADRDARWKASAGR